MRCYQAEVAIRKARQERDQVIGRMIIACIKSFFALFDEKQGANALDAHAIELAAGGRYLHDREIGKAIASHHKEIGQIFEKKLHLQHHPV